MKFFIILNITFFFSVQCFSNQLFETDFFNVEFTSDNVEEMKNQKISEIKKISIDSIFKKILLKDDYSNIKRNFNENYINTFIKNIIIENEKIINNSYSSNIKINFHINSIVNELRIKNIPYIEYEPKNFLTIIYEKDNLQTNLLTKNNTYYDYLIKNKDQLSFFEVPNLDLNDRYLLNIQDIETNNIERFNLFINKYSKLDVILIKSYKLNSNKKYEIYLYDNNHNNFKLIKTLSTNYDLLNFFNDIQSIVLDKWKEKNIIQNTEIKIINCNIIYFNLLELKEIINKIKSMTFIIDIKLDTISYKKNNYTIEYYGNKKILFNSFVINNLQFNDSSNNCVIKLI